MIDFGRDIAHHRHTVNGRQIEHLEVGAHRFLRLSANRQQATGRLWLWENGCPYGNYWTQVFTAVRHIASWTGSGVEVLAGEPVHRYSFSIKPRRRSFLAKLLGKEKDPSLGKLRAHLHAHGIDRINLDIRLAGDLTIRKMREHHTGLEIALLDGRTSIVRRTSEYSDFGVTVDIAAPLADEVLGGPAE